MEIKKFDYDRDYDKVIQFFRDSYSNNKVPHNWLAQRFEDLVYRISVMEEKEEHKLPSSDFIYLWVENDEIVGVLVPDGDAVFTNIKKGYESIFESMVLYAEDKLIPLFKEKDGYVDFYIWVNKSADYKINILNSMGYKPFEQKNYSNYVYPKNTNFSIELPEGYYVSNGEELDIRKKGLACHLGFHPGGEDKFVQSMDNYYSRMKCPMYKDSYETIIVSDKNDICSYSFCYVDKDTRTGFIEPVCTKEEYRRKGIGTAMMHAIVNKLKDNNIDKVYVDSFDWRKKFYNASGFITEDETIGYHKLI